MFRSLHTKMITSPNQKCQDYLHTDIFRSHTHRKVHITYTPKYSDHLYTEMFIRPTQRNVQITCTQKCLDHLHTNMFRWPTHRSVMWFWFTQLGIFADAVSCCAVMRFYLCDLPDNLWKYLFAMKAIIYNPKQPKI